MQNVFPSDKILLSPVIIEPQVHAQVTSSVQYLVTDQVLRIKPLAIKAPTMLLIPYSDSDLTLSKVPHVCRELTLYE